MLDAHPEAAQCMVVGAFVRGQRPVLAFLVRDIGVRVVVLQPLITAIDVGARAVR